MTKAIKIINSADLSKVKDNTLNAQQLDFMLGKTPPAQIYTRPAKGGGTWNYVTGTYIKKVLNLMFGWDWDFEVVEYKYDLTIKQVFVLGKLRCRTNGKEIIKMQFGRKDIICKKGTDIPLDLGNDLKAATTDALKKCASEIGIASDVYAPQEFKEISISDAKEFPELLPDTDDFETVINTVKTLGYSMEQLRRRWTISEETENELIIRTA